MLSYTNMLSNTNMFRTPDSRRQRSAKTSRVPALSAKAESASVASNTSMLSRLAEKTGRGYTGAEKKGRGEEKWFVLAGRNGDKSRQERR